MDAPPPAADDPCSASAGVPDSDDDATDGSRVIEQSLDFEELDPASGLAQARYEPAELFPEADRQMEASPPASPGSSLAAGSHPSSHNASGAQVTDERIEVATTPSKRPPDRSPPHSTGKKSTDGARNTNPPSG